MSKPAAKHTPEPWSLHPEWDADDEIDIVRDGPEHIDSHTVATVRVGNQLTNARLIAAAPEMLEALQLAQQMLTCEQGHIRGEGPAWKLFCDLITAVPAAIAKAERGE